MERKGRGGESWEGDSSSPTNLTTNLLSSPYLVGVWHPPHVHSPATMGGREGVGEGEGRLASWGGTVASALLHRADLAAREGAHLEGAPQDVGPLGVQPKGVEGGLQKDIEKSILTTTMMTIPSG